MTTPEGYDYCIGGHVFMVCQRCAALVCDNGNGIRIHDAFHDSQESSST